MRIKKKAGNKDERSFVVWLVTIGILLVGSYTVFIGWISKPPKKVGAIHELPLQKNITSIMDPVCKMMVKPPAAGHAVHKGKAYYFCSIPCKEDFEKEPEKYLKGIKSFNVAE